MNSDATNEPNEPEQTTDENDPSKEPTPKNGLVLDEFLRARDSHRAEMTEEELAADDERQREADCAAEVRFVQSLFNAELPTGLSEDFFASFTVLQEFAVRLLQWSGSIPNDFLKPADSAPPIDPRIPSRSLTHNVNINITATGCCCGCCSPEADAEIDDEGQSR